MNADFVAKLELGGGTVRRLLRVLGEELKSTLSNDLSHSEQHDFLAARPAEWDPRLLYRALFKDGERLRADMLRLRIGSSTVSALERLGLLTTHPDGNIEADVRVILWNDNLVASDWGAADWNASVVYPFTESTKSLSALALDTQVAQAVDVGSGAGAIALDLAKCADRVLAIDLNPRAVALTALSAALNGEEKVEAIAGSLLDPVSDESSDRILGNLPFVLSPDTALLMRDGDRDQRKLLKDCLQGAARCLSKDGVAQYTCHWPSQPDDPCVALETICSDVGLSAVVIRMNRRSALDHVAFWTKAEDATAEIRRTMARRWLKWLDSEDISEVSFGVISAWRADGQGSFRLFDTDRPPRGKGGRMIGRIISAMRTGEIPPKASPRIVPHDVEQILTHDGHSYSSAAGLIVADDSAGLTVEIDVDAIGMLAALDGTTPLRELGVKAEPLVSKLWQKGLLEL